jgi:hypothetical protein
VLCLLRLPSDVSTTLAVHAFKVDRFLLLDNVVVVL